jgi:hypothetical protein
MTYFWLPWLVGTLLGIIGLLFMGYPLYERSRRAPLDERFSLASQAENEQAARSALTEVELDFQLGNLAELDYRTLRERYLRRAFAARKSRLAHADELDTLIEERLRQMREQQTPASDTENGDGSYDLAGNDDGE